MHVLKAFLSAHTPTDGGHWMSWVSGMSFVRSIRSWRSKFRPEILVIHRSQCLGDCTVNLNFQMLQAVPVISCVPFLHSFTFRNKRGEAIFSFKITDCTPPAHRSEHEMRVIMREAIPRYLTQQLPPGTVHYGDTVVDATASSKGRRPQTPARLPACHALYN